MKKTSFVLLSLALTALFSSGISHAASATRSTKVTTRKTAPAAAPESNSESAGRNAPPQTQPPRFGHEQAPAVQGTYGWKGFSVGAVTGYVDYKEPGLMREYGLLYGVNGSYTSLNEVSGIQWNLEGELVAGRILYDGGDQGGNRYTQPTSDYIAFIRATVGAYREMTTSWSATPFIGVGLRDLNDKIDGSGSYNRNISYLYIPVGAQIAGFVTDKWSLSFVADLDLMVSGTVVSKLSEASSALPDVTNHDKGVGTRITATSRWDLGSIGIHTGLFYQKWKIEQSDIVAVTISGQKLGFAEPENESDFVGLNAGVDF